MGKGFRLKRVRILDGQEVDLASRGLAFGAEKSKDGWVLFQLSVPKGQHRVHITVLIQGERLTVHATDQETGEHTHLLSLDAATIRERLDPSLLEAFEQRLLKMLYFAPDPASLEAVGVRKLVPMPMPVNEDACRMLSDGTLEALSPPPTTDLAAPWGSSPGFAWVAYDRRNRSIGAAYPGYLNGSLQVLFVYWEELQHVFRWLAKKIGLPVPPGPAQKQRRLRAHLRKQREGTVAVTPTSESEEVDVAMKDSRTEQQSDVRLYRIMDDGEDGVEVWAWDYFREHGRWKAVARGPQFPGGKGPIDDEAGAPRPDGENSFDNLAEACDAAIRLLRGRMQGYQASIARLERLKSEPL